MIFYAVGVNHKTAPVAVREELHLSPDEITAALERLHPSMLREACIVSTCNRTELYGIPAQDGINGQHLTDALRHLRPSAQIPDTLFFKTFTCGAVSHLFRVAASLESQVLGDIQILGQVKDAYETAVRAGTIGNIFNHLFRSALHTGKRVRSATGIGIGAVSISFAAIELAKKIFDDLQRKTVLVIGMGETGSLAARSMASRGVERLLISNRTRARAEELAPELHAEVVDYPLFPEHLSAVDLVISATASVEYILNMETVRRAMQHRQNRPLLIIDIAVPRNVDPKIAALPNVFLKDLDALQGIVDHNLERRTQEVPKAEQIVTEEVVNFFLWFNSLEAIPAIQLLRGKFEQIRAAEFERFRNKLGAQDLETVEMLTRRIINKLLHPTMVSLKQPSLNPTARNTRVEVLREVFDLDKPQPERDTTA